MKNDTNDLIECSLDMFDNLMSIRDNYSDYSDIKTLSEALFDFGWSWELSTYIIENTDFENLSEYEFEEMFESAYNMFEIKG